MAVLPIFAMYNCGIELNQNMALTPIILIIEDHDVVVFSIKITLKENYPSAVIHTANAFGAGLMHLTNNKYDLIILDIDVPEGESYRMIEMIRSRQMNVRILIFSGKDELTHGIRFLNEGANGFLSKSAPIEHLKLAVARVLSDKTYMGEKLQNMINNQYFKKEALVMPSKPDLSPRENEVLELLLQGKTSKEIANDLRLKESTVGTHKARIFQKMEVSNILALFQKLMNLN